MEVFMDGMEYQQYYSRWLLGIKLITTWKVSLGFINKYQKGTAWADVEIAGSSDLTPDQVWELAKEKIIRYDWLNPPRYKK